MTTTDMVRCRSLVEQTRVLTVEILSSADLEEEEEDSTDIGEDGAAEEHGWDIDEERLHMDAARIYENTVVQLGERLGDPLGNENKVDNSIVCTK